jgi:phosphate starvation-inducible PhoH-like protein
MKRESKSNIPKAPKSPVNYANMLKFRLTESQQVMLEKILNNKITTVTGPAGSAKTFVSCYAALQLLSENKIKKIILTKPIKEAGESLGFLPGSIEDKINPYMESFIVVMNKLIGDEAVKMLIQHEVIEMKPLAYLRGVTLENSLMMMDESQNCDFRTMMLYVTRLGKGTKMILAGDVSQYDIERKKVKFPDFIKMLDGIKGVVSHEFFRDDIVRDKILIEITDRYEEYRKLNNLD